jgi:Uma2 family endonuclease
MSMAASAPDLRHTEDETVPVYLRPNSGVRVSPEEFWRICADNPDLRLERSADGELEIMPPAGTESGSRNASITGQLWLWNRGTGLGVAFDSSAGFTLPNTAVRGPDAAWIAAERYEALSLEERERFAEICPDFVVELRSRSDRPADLRKKMGEYLDQGVRLAWLIDPFAKSVEIYRPGRPVETLAKPASLSGEDVLPGFVLDLRGILPD